ncbi:MAG: hypothetical protein HC906_04800 [Bacteroidales bacterium]|nr:hypothetical protein [Bacteroidales bacterium]
MSQNRNLYFYPISANSGTSSVPNPYLTNLIKALSCNFNVINYKRPAKSGILDVIKYFSPLNIFILTG